MARSTSETRPEESTTNETDGSVVDLRDDTSEKAPAKTTRKPAAKAKSTTTKTTTVKAATDTATAPAVKKPRKAATTTGAKSATAKTTAAKPTAAKPNAAKSVTPKTKTAAATKSANVDESTAKPTRAKTTKAKATTKPRTTKPRATAKTTALATTTDSAPIIGNEIVEVVAPVQSISDAQAEMVARPHWVSTTEVIEAAEAIALPEADEITIEAEPATLELTTAEVELTESSALPAIVEVDLREDIELTETADEVIVVQPLSEDNDEADNEAGLQVLAAQPGAETAMLLHQLEERLDEGPVQSRRSIWPVAGAIGLIVGLAIGSAVGSALQSSDNSTAVTTIATQNLQATQSNTTAIAGAAASTSTAAPAAVTTVAPTTTAAAVVGSDVVNLAGNASKQSDVFTLSDGQANLNYKSSGGSLTVRLLDSTGAAVGGSFLCVSSCEHQVAISPTAGDYRIAVDSKSSSWTVSIDH